MPLSRSLIAAPIAIVLAAGATAQTHTVSGRVIDPHGRHAAGVELSTQWSFTPEGATPYKPLSTGDDGSFTGEITYYNQPTALYAMSADRTLGGIAVLSPATIDDPITITLSPLVSVSGRITCKDLGYRPEWTNVYAQLMPDRLRVGSSSSREATFSFSLPAGEWSFWMYGTDLQYHTENVTLGADDRAHDLGVIDIPASIIAMHYGKEPPKWNVTGARGVPTGIQPSYFKGKWTLVEYWGYW